MKISEKILFFKPGSLICQARCTDIKSRYKLWKPRSNIQCIVCVCVCELTLDSEKRHIGTRKITCTQQVFVNNDRKGKVISEEIYTR